MAKAKVLIDDGFDLNSKYRVEISVLQFEKTERFPSGLKVRIALINTVADKIRFLIDNHEPYGFHMHTKLPEDKSVRKQLFIKDYQEAIGIFWQEVEGIIQSERY